ncbi:A/G-specific adenine glycosylase [Litorimonas sp. RW-G-Af-16]|uniref:A/G-specific adenine glycosylase n=1 Tax=Litorimonas sp. RW-G-Af-16 TaxID=3241168 RepID=UPI00390C4AA5
MKSSTDIRKMRDNLLAWYDAQGRTLPWRVRPEDRARGITPDPYAIWLSEIMSQQTTIPHATPYWEKFLAEFPTVIDLANADREQVMAMWAGLGYYARARNLYKCAQIVRDEFGGVFPQSESELLKLPGIGPYTAATIAAICFDEATNIVDGNVERVISRIFRVQNPLPKAKNELRDLARALASPKRAGDYGQALMDLGATVCTPTSPKCKACPWQTFCAAFKAGDPTDFPKKMPKKKQPIRYGAVFILLRGEEILLERRPDTGLLGGMTGLPGTEWASKPPKDPFAAAPAMRNWEKLDGPEKDGRVKHVFTHFELRLDIYRAETAQKPDGHWVAVATLPDQAVPTAYKKALRAAGLPT